jgi:hypothetical protein
MKIKTGLETEYASYKEKNSHDGYSARVVSYGEDWAKLLEAGIPDDATEAQVIGILGRDDFANNASHTADTDGITGFMYGCAVSAMSRFWIHGEALRRWHNKDTQIGTEGDEANKTGGVLNPALLVIQ